MHVQRPRQHQHDDRCSNRQHDRGQPGCFGLNLRKAMKNRISAAKKPHERHGPTKPPSQTTNRPRPTGHRFHVATPCRSWPSRLRAHRTGDRLLRAQLRQAHHETVAISPTTATDIGKMPPSCDRAMLSQSRRSQTKSQHQVTVNAICGMMCPACAYSDVAFGIDLRRTFLQDSCGYRARPKRRETTIAITSGRIMKP